MLKNFKKWEVIFANSFEHQGLDYEFKYYKAKLGKSYVRSMSAGRASNSST